jgi:RNA polymerase sigma-70 factor (ECF subfamily)
MNAHPLPSIVDLTDAELAARAVQGDPRAFELIMRRHNRLLYRTARSVLKNDHEAEDAVQEAYFNAWKALASFRADARLSTWLVRIVLNEALGRLRRRHGNVVPLEPDDGTGTAAGTPAPAEADFNEQPDRQASRAELRRVIETRIDALPEVFRTVFVLRAVEEYTVDEVAVVLGIPEITVRTRFFRARSLLREGLARDVDHALEDAFPFAGARCDRTVARVLARLAESRQE